MISESNELLLEAVSARAPVPFEVWTWKGKHVYLVLEAVDDHYVLLGLCDGVVHDRYPLESFVHNMGPQGFWQRVA